MKRSRVTFAVVGAGLLAPCGVAFAQEAPPAYLELKGVIRDFLEYNNGTGHPDFEIVPTGGFGHYMGNVATQLDEEGKPVFAGEGQKVRRQWKDVTGRPIHPSVYDPSRGDAIGEYSNGRDSGGIRSGDTFHQWYRDVPGKNLSEPLSITLTRSGGTDEAPVYTYVNNAFFPIDGKLFGNSGGSTPSKNYHFTYELHTEFTYRQGVGQYFSFYGDDDVWVFINNRLVIDLGGIHQQTQQVVELDRLGLVDGQKYPLDFFFAERHRVQSNFRIDTSVILQTNPAFPTVSAAYD